MIKCQEQLKSAISLKERLRLDSQPDADPAGWGHRPPGRNIEANRGGHQPAERSSEAGAGLQAGVVLPSCPKARKRGLSLLVQFGAGVTSYVSGCLVAESNTQGKHSCELSAFGILSCRGMDRSAVSRGDAWELKHLLQAIGISRLCPNMLYCALLLSRYEENRNRWSGASCRAHAS